VLLLLHPLAQPLLPALRTLQQLSRLAAPQAAVALLLLPRAHLAWQSLLLPQLLLLLLLLLKEGPSRRCLMVQCCS
jgi:hypothetical protein